ncbi:NAD(P)-dependent oxidoreductase [Solemya velum gill symbiont]|uniref:NAD(P)-dependent oxidoreductase n=1 Tax=Solemya velum gill symbiont TaxID=2340 RepID=UPI0009976887|nr:NAD(P)-dependent oxidoreductase [Solemya velum gill symbiont]
MKQSLDGMTIGFIGLGLMGKPMCANLHSAGANLVVHNRTHAVAEAMQQDGIKAVTTPVQVAELCDLVIIMTPDTTSVENVLFGEQGLSKVLHSRSLVIDMGTTAVTPTREFASRLAECGAEYIDAPVSGCEIGAIDGDLVIMAGGSKGAIHRAQPVFDVLGKSTVHIGEVGTGQVTKAANQVIVGLNIGAVAEAFTLASGAGADLNKVREALMGGFASSRILEVHGQRMIDESFAPGGKITTQYKDLSQAIDLAAEFSQQLPATELNKSLYGELIDAGKGGLDHSALILALETHQVEK